MSFNYSDVVNPLATRFNDGFNQFISDVKKHIGFDEEKDIAGYPQKDRNGFISGITLERWLDGRRIKTATFHPSTNGRFDVIYHDLSSDKRIERKDIHEMSYFSDSQCEGRVFELKEFFQLKAEAAV